MWLCHILLKGVQDMANTYIEHTTSDFHLKAVEKFEIEKLFKMEFS